MDKQLSRPRGEVKVLFDYKLANAPGMSTVGFEVTYTPNAWTPPHRHGGATVVAFVTEGEVLSGMNGNPPQVYRPGESFMELPGCHHTVSENNSKEKSAKLVAVFTIETATLEAVGYAGLTQLDEGWE
ncbi:RmlC-like cupin domain-containing protein [Mariannaea sp. PMI_226]|nr:RmlC-like cupin domain-containing protein [Mariannaea sp. PMI_226]